MDIFAFCVIILAFLVITICMMRISNKKEPQINEDDYKYNGPKTELMDELYDSINEHVDVDEFDDWAQLSLFIARACFELSNKWIKYEIIRDMSTESEENDRKINS